MAAVAPRPTPWRLSFIQPDGSVVWAAKAAPSNDSATPDALRKARFKVTADAEEAIAFPSKVAARHALLTWGRVLQPGERAKATFHDPDAEKVPPPPPSTAPELAPAAGKPLRSALVDLVEAEAALDGDEIEVEETKPSVEKPKDTFSTRKRW